MLLTVANSPSVELQAMNFYHVEGKYVAPFPKLITLPG
jgi:hypothetical protein